MDKKKKTNQLSIFNTENINPKQQRNSVNNKLDNNHKSLRIFTDGACKGNPGPGAWAFNIYEDSTIIKTGTGAEVETTNNKMEILAAIKSLEALQEITINHKYEVLLLSDSAYVVNCFNDKWIDKWISNGWKNNKGDSVLNKDLWIRLFNLISHHEVKIEHVRSGSNLQNVRVDKIAKSEAWKLNKSRKDSK